MTCSLCHVQPANEGKLCDDCTMHVHDGFRPVICMGCQSAGAEHVTWVPILQLTDDTRESLEELEKGLSGVSAFVRVSCPTCSKEEQSHEEKSTD